jgi:hypothetical protein
VADGEAVAIEGGEDARRLRALVEGVPAGRTSASSASG